MLNSLYIKNYRNLVELQINSVAQINLLTGKNNTGKSSVLEALGIICASKGQGTSLIDFLDNLLKKRKEFSNDNGSYLPFFTDNLLDFNINNQIIIGEQKENAGTNVIISFHRFFDIKTNDENGHTTYTQMMLNDDDVQKYPNFYIAERIDYTSGTGTLKKENGNLIFVQEKKKSDAFRFINANGFNDISNDREFDRISLLDIKKQSIIDALRIIEPQISNLSFVADNPNEERKPKVALAGSSEIMSLTRMGDGINRILTIILAAVNCENGFLLIDEFENGLHYTVQEQLWKIIFKLAKGLNIQVFATTHSNDTINSFSDVLNSKNSNGVSGKMIRLDNKNSEIRAVEIEADILKIATEQSIETR